MRVVLRICPNYGFPEAAEYFLEEKPKYYYEGEGAQKITIYEKNMRIGGKTFVVDQIYNSTTSQYDFFYKEVHPLIPGVMQGSDAFVVLLGHNQGGRRYSFEGAPEHPGLFYRCLDTIFTQLNIQTSQDYRVLLSCLQLDKDTMKDAFAISNKKLVLKEDNLRGVVVEGATQTVIRSPQSGIEALEGNRLRISADPTSHTVVNVTVEKMANTTGYKQKITKKTVGTLSFVLVGSPVDSREVERSRRDKADWVTNLLTCMGALEQKIPVIPFHKSKFTFLLRDFLIGTKSGVAILSMSANIESYKEVIHLLNVCQKAKDVAPKHVEPAPLKQEQQKAVESKQPDLKLLPKKANTPDDSRSKAMNDAAQMIAKIYQHSGQNPLTIVELQRLLEGSDLSQLASYSSPFSTPSTKKRPTTATPPRSKSSASPFQKGMQNNTPERIQHVEAPDTKPELQRPQPPSQLYSYNSPQQEDQRVFAEKPRTSKSQLNKSVNILPAEVKEQKAVPRPQTSDQKSGLKTRPEVRSRRDERTKVTEPKVENVKPKEEPSRPKSQPKKRPASNKNDKELNVYVEVMESAVKRIKESNKQLEAANADLQKQLQKKDKQLRKEVKDRQNLQKEVSEMRKQLDQVTVVVEQLKAEKDEINKSKLSLYHENQTLMLNYKTLQLQVEKMQEEFLTKGKGIKEEMSHIGNLDISSSRNSGLVTIPQEKLNRFEQYMRESMEVNERLRNDIITKVNELSDAKQQLERYQQEVEQLKIENHYKNFALSEKQDELETEQEHTEGNSTIVIEEEEDDEGEDETIPQQSNNSEEEQSFGEAEENTFGYQSDNQLPFIAETRPAVNNDNDNEHDHETNGYSGHNAFPFTSSNMSTSTTEHESSGTEKEKVLQVQLDLMKQALSHVLKELGRYKKDDEKTIE